MLDQTFYRLQKLVSQLELLDEKLLQEDVNQKLLRSLSPEWNTHAVVWRNKADLDTMSMDDLYNNLKVYEPEVKGMFLIFMHTNHRLLRQIFKLNNTLADTNEAVNTAHGVSTASTQVNAAKLTNINNLSLESVEEKLEVYKANESIYLQDIKGLKFEIHLGEIAIRELRKKLETVQKEKDGIQLNVDKFEHASKIPLLYTGNFMPPTPDLSFTGLDEFVNKPVVENCKAMSSEEEPKVVRKNDDALIIEDWVSDDEE
ncbi:hypothetical protein Tco_1392182 [Tanacetum coccineum]